MVLAFFLLELHTVLREDYIVLSVRAGLLLLGEADEAEDALFLNFQCNTLL